MQDSDMITALVNENEKLKIALEMANSMLMCMLFLLTSEDNESIFIPAEIIKEVVGNIDKYSFNVDKSEDGITVIPIYRGEE